MLYWGDLYTVEEKSINYLTDRIQPFMLIKMPDKVVPIYTPGQTIYNRWDDFDLTKTWEGGFL